MMRSFPRSSPWTYHRLTKVPSGPMTRARARALETEVTSLLSQFHFDEHETWLLSQTETLCILRYQGVSHGDAKEQGESEEEDGREDGEEKGLSQQKPGRSGPPSGRSGLSPDDPDSGPDDPDNVARDTREGIMKMGHPDPGPDHLAIPGRPDQVSDIRPSRSCSSTAGRSGRQPRSSDPRSPDHPDQRPDHPAAACVRDLGQGPCTRFVPPLTYSPLGL